MLVKSLTQLVGNTPMLELCNYGAANGLKAKLLAKLEFFEPASSIKDRIALEMIVSAEQRGLLKSGDTIIEPTSGNTGIGLAWIAACRGYKMILTMPETMSVERRKLATQFGAKIELTPGSEGMNGAIARAKVLQASIKGSVILGQFENAANPECHRKTTAKEILADTNGKIDIFVSCVGTGGTITGVGEVLRAEIPDIKIYAVEPFGSPVLSGGKAGPHKIQGIGAGFIPPILNLALFEGICLVKDEEAIAAAKALAVTEGLLVGISSGAAVAAAARLALLSENAGKTIVVILPDTGERYLSTALFD